MTITGRRVPPALRRWQAMAARQRRRATEDTGTSLAELSVGMTLMAVFLAMFTGAIVMMNSSMNKSQAVNASATQLNTAFLTLDRAVRYAAFISTPGTGTSGDWYVELRMTNTGAEICKQLRIDIPSQQLQSRSWTVVNASASTPGPWVPISSGISNGNAAAGPLTQPFYIVPATNTAFQQLRVLMTAPAGPASASTTSNANFTFTAVNSTISAPTSSICQQQGRP